MKAVNLTLPELALVIGTRAMLGAGIALLLADKLDDKPRRAVGLSFVAIGVLTTVPLAFQVFGKNKGR